MALSPEEFAQQAREGMRAPARYTPDHPTIVAIRQGSLGLAELRKWAVQTYLFLRDHPRVFAYVYGNCPDPEVRSFILRVLVEEEMGLYTKTGRHLPYLARFCHALGVKDLDDATPTTTTTEVIEWWIRTAKERPFIEAWGTWAFSNQRTAFGRVYEGLQAHYDLSEDDIFFWKQHAEPFVSMEERAKEFAAVSKYLTTDAVQEQVRRSAFRLAEGWMAVWTHSQR